MIQKYIYFPTGQETRLEKNVPVIIYVFDIFKDQNRFYVKGSVRESEAERCSGKFFLMNRAVIYNDALWEACVEYKLALDSVQDQYKELFKKRKKIK